MLKRVAMGDGAAVEPDAILDFDSVFRREFPVIARTTYLIVHEWAMAEEIAQDAFLELYRKWPRVSRYDRPGAWVRRVALRMAVKAARREQRRGGLERAAVDALPGRHADADDDIIQAVGQLPAAQRAAVVLFYFEDRPVLEVADLLGCAPATAKVHLHRARLRLADLLGEELDDVSDRRLRRDLSTAASTYAPDVEAVLGDVTARGSGAGRAVGSQLGRWPGSRSSQASGCSCTRNADRSDRGGERGDNPSRRPRGAVCRDDRRRPRCGREVDDGSRCGRLGRVHASRG